MDYASPGGTDTSTDLDVEKMSPAVTVLSLASWSLLIFFSRMESPYSISTHVQKLLEA
jgi:hypothetical protein